MGELRQRGNIWWIRYYRDGKRYEESSGSPKKGTAIDLLKIREGDGARGVPVTAKIGRFRFEDAAADLVNDYRANGKKTLGDVERRITLHLQPNFGGRRMASVSPADIRAYVAKRQQDAIVIGRGAEQHTRPYSNGEINRELTALKRMFSLAVQAGKL